MNGTVNGARNDTSGSGLTERLARHVVSSLDAPVPEATLAKARLHILDTLGAVVSGYDLKAGALARDFVHAYHGLGRASVAVSGAKIGADAAAFANATAAHADETDDAHPASITHPGCAVVPAALAMAEHAARSGMDLLKAVVLGYDFCARTGMALGGGRFLTEKGFDPHAFGGTLGAGAAAAAMACFDMRQAAWALSYSAQQVSGLGTVFRDRNHVEKAFVFAGKPARDGVGAALLVQSGFTGVDDAFDGEWNFWRAFGAPEAAAFFDDLGSVYEIERTNIKRWSVGSPAQAVLDSVEALHREQPLVAEDIETITVRLPVEGAMVVNNRHMPSVNVQHLTALMIVDGGLGFISSHDEARMTDLRVLSLRSRVVLEPDAELSRVEPSRQAIVEILDKSGNRRCHHTRAVRGTTDNPMTWEEVVAKSLDLMEPALGVGQARAVVSAVAGLAEAPTVGPLVDALCRRPYA